MRVPRLYLAADFALDSQVELTREQAHYALTVLRLKNEHPVELFNGSGAIAGGKIIVLGRKDAHVLISSLTQADNESPLKTVLVQGISRGDRMDYSIQKAVELGVTAIQPVFTERCEVKLAANKIEKRREQWQTIAINACEQSGRAFVPEVLPMMTFKEFSAQNPDIQGIVCDPYAPNTLATLQEPNLQQNLHFLVGPEGGLTEEEVEFALENGWQSVRLGPRILRTETAGPTMLAIAQSLWGDL